MRGTSKHYRKKRALALSLNDRYKKSDDCIKIIGNTLDFICKKMGVKAKVGVTQPSMPKTLKEVPSFLLCTILWYWIRRIWYSRHVRQFIFILILCSWALSIGLTLFLARDNAGLLRNRRENSFIKHQSQNLKTDEIRILWTNEAQFYPWRKKMFEITAK